MKITLLTHRKEFGKRSNTGQLVAQVLGGEAEQVAWERTRPPAALLAAIAQGGVALVWPGSGALAPAELPQVGHYVIIDGTWLTARKIHQRSPYLHGLPRVALQPVAPSIYNLRHHQIDGGLCTAECAIELLRQVGRSGDAERLHQAFVAFIKPPS
ncbi:MAG: DTW domain-containing protein [Deltaproteobacteria bacterium]|nr:DTW domain-containing protein [Deltaproteobacteria bacterium]